MVGKNIGLTFDDVLLEPGYAGFFRSEISLKSQLTKKIELSAPLLSAPMDTVTESKLAIALAKCGGLGFIHRNLTIKDQAAEVEKVKTAGLLVGAAVGSRSGYEKRVAVLVKAGADVILIDSAHGYSKQVIDAVRNIKKTFPEMQLIAGNVATAAGAKALIEAGVDGLRVGMGPGAICSTRLISGMGVPQLTAIFDTVSEARKYQVPVIADGGIKYSGDITKALSAGASSVMLGRIFAASQESPGKEVVLTREEVPARFQSIINGARSYVFKQYRGMGSLAAMKKGMEVSSEDEFHGKSYTSDTLIAEGVEGMVPCSGPLEKTVNQLLGGLQSGMYYVGAKSIDDLWNKATFSQITQASLTESHPHNLFVTNSGGNLG